MAKFTTEQATAAVAIQQLINDWAYDLDFNDNVNVGDVITDDVVYNVGGTARKGKKEVEAFYAARREKIKGNRPTIRHINTNFRVTFKAADQAEVFFELVFWSTEVPGLNPADVVAVADVWMKVRVEKDGHWRIYDFDSTQPLKRV